MVRKRRVLGVLVMAHLVAVEKEQVADRVRTETERATVMPNMAGGFEVVGRQARWR